MGLDQDLAGLSSALENPQSLLEEVVKDLEIEDVTTTNDLLLLIQQLLWNELDELPHHSIIIAGIGFYYLDDLDLVDIKVLLNKYFIGNHLTNIEYTKAIYLILIKIEDPGSDYVKFFQDNMKEFGVDNLELSTVIDVVNEIETVDEKYDIISTKVISLQNRPEYTDDIIENTEIDDLQILQHWLNPDLKDKIVSELLKRKLDVELPNDYKETLDYFQNDDFLVDYSLSHEVMAEKIAQYEPRSIDMTQFEDLPSELSRSWLPKFVYSKPELEENIRVYFPGGPHIGHSAILVKSNFGSFMMDFGLSVVNTSKSRWMPLMEKLDFILISHAHMDHSGSLPILYGKERKIPWFGLEETKVMTEMLWSDTRKILGRTVTPSIFDRSPYLRRLVSRGSIINTLKNFNAMKTDSSYQLLPNINVKPHHAAHLFGSVGFEITIGGKRILYTGDFNGDKGVEFPTDCDITLFDSTYFERYQDYPKPEEGLEFALENSNRLLIPAFSMGRSQEILFKLKELEAEKEWTIYLTGMGGRLASKLNLNVGSTRGRNKGGVQIVPTVDPEDFVENSIVIGGQGMLQAGTSRRLFEHTKDDEDTSVILCGYQAPNTLGYHLLNDHQYLAKYKQNIQRVKISGHTTGETLDQFMDNLSNRKFMVHAPQGAYKDRKRDDVSQPTKFDPVIL